MSEQKKQNTEEKILDAAKNIFVRKGKSGARMQEIADKAGINKSLLHYYYRSKDKLFGAVFQFAFSNFAPNLLEILNEDNDIFEVIETFISKYLDVINKNPFIPMFILNEVNKKDTGFIVRVLKNSGINVKIFENLTQKEIKNGKIKNVDAKQLLVNILALCVFPYLGRPLLEVIIYNDNKNDYDNFLENRKKEVTELIINSIKK
ncbi:MAG: TetR/AcrR family transcriptional regulator [Bacteroidales bacterium]|nr:TetR/AcrR family transcriptional regulator [Bacteroidales bacterium]